MLTILSFFKFAAIFAVTGSEMTFEGMQEEGKHVNLTTTQAFILQRLFSERFTVQRVILQSAHAVLGHNRPRS